MWKPRCVGHNATVVLVIQADQLIEYVDSQMESLTEL
ncbi:hypothetical protein AGR9A_Lc50082 [Agrobacterium salinitolerans str. Hayward 0363]|nr:hypothetical protein AGR9A_Lc50082 [Agrobacterium salinitolerans str. Hayward 0363]